MDGSSNKNLMTAPAMAAGRSQSEEGNTLDRGSSNQLQQRGYDDDKVGAFYGNDDDGEKNLRSAEV